MSQLKDIWEQIPKGEKTALFDLYNELYFHLYRFGISLYSDSNTVKDCISQLFLKLWEKRQTLPQVNNVKAYLFTSLRNTLYDFLSDEQKANPHVFNSTQEELSYEEIIIRLEEDAEMQLKLKKALKKLTPTQLKLIRLKFYENCNYDEIATITSQTKKTAYNTIYDAIKILKKSILGNN